MTKTNVKSGIVLLVPVAIGVDIIVFVWLSLCFEVHD